MTDYSYQIDLAEKITKDATSPNTKAAVLAASPSAGKTIISHMAIQRYLKLYPESKVVVLTHGQNILKDQYLESLNSGIVSVDFSFGDFCSDSQVRVGLPHSFRKLKWDKIDLLVVDECHEFYLKKMVQEIIQKLQPKHQILMTGSPSHFNYLKKQGEKYRITYMSGDKLLAKGVFSSVEMDVVKVPFKGNKTEALSKMIEHARSKNKDLSKIMVAVNVISEAKNVAYMLAKMGRKVALSTSQNDPSSAAVKKFKQGDADALVVVQRGILGFSDNYISGLFDLRCSQDVDISNQLFSRVLRRHPSGINKFYYRCATEGAGDFNDEVIMLHKIKGMLNSDIFRKYDGHNMTVSIL